MSIEMLKLVDKIVYMHEGETIYFGPPFEVPEFVTKVLKIDLHEISNPICLLSNLLNKNIARRKKLKDSN